METYTESAHNPSNYSIIFAVEYCNIVYTCEGNLMHISSTIVIKKEVVHCDRWVC